MKKIFKKGIFGIFCALMLFLGTVSTSDAAYCNSPCPDPCAPSRTVCEGLNCTTYCDSSNSVRYTIPSASFSISTPNVSFSVSNEIYTNAYNGVYGGTYWGFSRPNIFVTSRPIYNINHYRPVHKPVYKPAHKPQYKPQNKPGHKPVHKPLAPHKKTSVKR